MTAWRAQADPWYLTWGIVYEFLRIATHPRVFRRPWSPAEAWRFVDLLLGSLLSTSRRARGPWPKASCQDWIVARLRHHLSHAHVQMARELGMNLPRFIEELYLKRFGRERPEVVMSVEERARAAKAIGARAGRHSWGYVEPTETAWEILEEAVDPFLADMQRQIQLGLEAAATATRAG